MTTQNGEKRKSGGDRLSKRYRESFGLLAGIVIFGFLVEAFTPPGKISLPYWPWNIVIIAGYIIITAIVFFNFKGRVVKRIVGIPSTVAAVSSMTILVILMGFIPQEDMPGTFITQLGLTHVTRSWPYLLVALYLVTVLTFAIYKRAYPLTLKNGAFLLNHAGLWIVLVAASLGTADLKRLNMTLTEGQKKETAVGANETKYKLPFAIQLHDFQLEQYKPKIAIYDHATGKPLEAKQTNPIRIEPGLNHAIGDWELEVKKYLPSAIKKGEEYIASETRGAAPAAMIGIKHKNNRNISKTGWITCGTRWMESQHFTLSRRASLVMLQPEAREYASEITIFHNNGAKEDYRLVVNKPYSFSGWKVYQSGYDSRSGKYSKVSVLELVFDPWLEAVYTGIFMMILGAFYLMFFGKRNK